MKMLTLFFLFALVGCASKIAAPDLEFITTNQGKNTGGTVIYNPLGLQQIVDQRRNQAFKRMRDVCRPGSFEIVKEETAPPEKRNPKYAETNAHVVTGNQVRFVDYKCVDL